MVYGTFAGRLSCVCTSMGSEIALEVAVAPELAVSREDPDKASTGTIGSSAKGSNLGRLFAADKLELADMEDGAARMEAERLRVRTGISLTPALTLGEWG